MTNEFLQRESGHAYDLRQGHLIKGCVKIRRDMKVHGALEAELVDDIDASTGGVRNVALYLEEVRNASRAAPVARRWRVALKDGRASCTCITATVGDVIEVRHMDSDMEVDEKIELSGHFVASLDAGDYVAKGPGRGVLMSLMDTTHSIRVIILTHKYHCVTEEGGFFALGDVPAGEYALVAQHPLFLGGRTRVVRIGTPNGERYVSFVVEVEPLPMRGAK